MEIFVMLVLAVMWMGSGVLAFGIHNHYIRFKYHTLYIKNYYSDDTDYYHDDKLSLYISMVGGPCALIASLAASSYPYGFLLMTRQWTQEEAAKLFPYKHTWRLANSNRLGK